MDSGESKAGAVAEHLFRHEGAKVVATLTAHLGTHRLQLVEDVAAAPVTTQGPRLEQHPRFPNRVNAGYLQVREPHRASLRVWERGAGITLACGSGACATLVAAG